jgi:hypothetical protein
MMARANAWMASIATPAESAAAKPGAARAGQRLAGAAAAAKAHQA